jgi:hypothetical protein
MAAVEELAAHVDKAWQYKKEKFIITGSKRFTGTVAVFTNLRTITFPFDKLLEFISELIEIPANEIKPKPAMVIAARTNKNKVYKTNPDAKYRNVASGEKRKFRPMERTNNKIDYEPLEPQVIHQSTDYSIFESIVGNRRLNRKKIDSIIFDIKAGLNLLPQAPCIIYKKEGKHMIVDGQHRFEISKEIGWPVFYIECPELSLRQIAKLNSRGEKWKNADFLNCYIELGVEDYKKLQQFILKYGLAIYVATDLLMHFNPNHKDTVEDFQNGEFLCRYYAEADDLMALTKSLFGNYSFGRDRQLIGAVKEIRKAGKCDFADLERKIKKWPGVMEKCTSIKLYMSAIEKVYNHNAQKRKIIF